MISMTTIARALSHAQSQLASSSTPRLDAQLLLEDVLRNDGLNVNRAYLLAYGDVELTQAQATHYQTLIDRRAQGEPVAYIRGRVGFYDREFIVTPAVLIPRPETELLVEQAIEWAREHNIQHAADIGTGSGAIALTVAAHVPTLTMHAIDISEAALAIARQNAAQQNSQNVTFAHGDLAQPLIAQSIRVPMLLANLPYIASNVMPTLDVSRHEPHLALDGGADGLDDIRRLLAQVPQVCQHGALILLEIGADQGVAVADLAQSLNPQSVAVLPDYAGHDRIVKIVI